MIMGIDKNEKIYYQDAWGNDYVLDVEFIRLVYRNHCHIDSPTNPNQTELWFDCLFEIYRENYGNDKCHVIINANFTECFGVEYDGTLIFDPKVMSKGLRKFVAKKLQKQIGT
jgi:hypothetical protein